MTKLHCPPPSDIVLAERRRAGRIGFHPGTVFGPVLGAFVLSAISEVLASEVTTVAGLFYGVVVVVAVLLMPRGLADLFRHFGAQRWGYFTHNIKSYRL